MSRRWGEHRKRLLRPTAQENRKGRIDSPSRCKGGSDGNSERGDSRELRLESVAMFEFAMRVPGIGWGFANRRYMQRLLATAPRAPGDD